MTVSGDKAPALEQPPLARVLEELGGRLQRLDAPLAEHLRLQINPMWKCQHYNILKLERYV